ncbi:hypothetical protein BURCENBC7_AP0490 [Burkholderia cenocepacia BC7]|nr:hypothetical protein BURCENBC7_AP0490 [Burkholderia cenocepacia BC7]
MECQAICTPGSRHATHSLHHAHLRRQSRRAPGRGARQRGAVRLPLRSRRSRRRRSRLRGRPPSRRAIPSSRPRPVGPQDRHQRPPSAADPRRARHAARQPRPQAGPASRRVRRARRRLCGAPVVAAALARPRFGRGARRRPAGVGSGRPAADDRRAATGRRRLPRRNAARIDGRCSGRARERVVSRARGDRCTRTGPLSRRK